MNRTVAPTFRSARVKRFCAIGVLACVSVPFSAQAPPPQGAPSTPPTSSARRFVVLGCISRETPSSTAAVGRGAATSASRYILTDPRGDTPKVYVLEGDESTLALHVGHTVEVAGPLSVAPAGAGPNANALIMKVSALMYLARTCVSLK